MKNIKRDKLLSSFIATIKKGSLLVVGDPGIGKSWLLKQALENISSEGIPHFFVQVDAIDVRSVADFKKALGLDNPIQDVLNYVSGGKRSILFIDALDAARGSTKQNIYKQFIELVQKRCPNWSIVASIRTYDAKHSIELLNLFPVRSPEPTNEYILDNVNYRHFFIPPLSETDVANFLSENIGLKDIYEKANDKLKKLFFVPFNLWLLDTLLNGGVDAKKISDMQTVVQLLGLYWEFRVVNKTDSFDRENILRKAAQTMVRDSSLSVWKEDVFIRNKSDVLKGILSDQMLVPVSSSEERIAFEHNMIFDYVVSRLLIQEDANSALSFLEKDPSRPIFLRPSIEYYFSRLWFSDRVIFWRIFWHFQSSGSNEYLNILPVITLVKEITDPSEFVPIQNRLDKATGVARVKCLEIINSIFRVLKALKSNKDIACGELWIEIMYSLRDKIDVSFIDEFIRTLKPVVDLLDKWSTLQQEKIGITARAIVNWAWQPPKALKTNQVNSLNHMIAVWGVPLVCKTFGTNSGESKKILRKVLKRVGSKAFIINEVYRLCDEMDAIWPHDPNFVVDIYRTVYGYEEKSQEMTAMRGGILSLTSNRRQDYEGCYYILDQKFPAFLKQCPTYATRAMVKSVNLIVKRKEISSWRKNRPVQQFNFFDIKTKFLEDGSSIWADREYRKEHLKMLGDFTGYLEELATKNDADSLKTIESLLLEIAQANEVAVIWKRLLRLSLKNPVVFAPLLAPLLKSIPILTSTDTAYEAGEILKAGFVLLKESDQKDIEKLLAIMPDQEIDEKKKERLIESRNTLLACIPKDSLSDTAKKILCDAEKSQKILPNEPYMKDMGFHSKPYTNIDWLKEKGANLEAETSKTILELVTPVKSFQEKFLNGAPSLEEINSLFPSIQKLKKEIERIDVVYDALVKQDVLTDLASACVRIARNNDLSMESEVFKACEEVFILAAHDRFPVYEKKYHDTFDSPGWGPAPRIEAAEGIMNLVRRKKTITPDNLRLIDALSADSVPAVRYNVIVRLYFLYKIAAKDMWKIAFRTARSEKTNGVLAALATSMSALVKINTDTVLDLFDIICKRKSLKKRKKSGVHNDPCVSTITELEIFFSNKRATAKIKVYEDNPLKYFDELQQVAISAINYLTIGLDGKEHQKVKVKSIRKKTRQLLSQLLNSAEEGFLRLNKRYKKDDWPEERKALIKELYDIIDIIARWLYFSATRDSKKSSILEENIKQYYFEIKPLINQIIDVGSSKNSFLHPSTTHHLMQLCNIIIKHDPAGVISIAENLCKASESYGYQLDSLAIGEVVSLVEICLADFKEILRDKKTILSLMNILNLFVKAGWPEAIQLAIRLDEVWR